jgi:hypothetical protein
MHPEEPNRAQEQLLDDMRTLMRDCLDGFRRDDSPNVWQERLTQIADLERRLNVLTRS